MEQKSGGMENKLIVWSDYTLDILHIYYKSYMQNVVD